MEARHVSDLRAVPDDAGCYRFHLRSASGEVIALSDTYPTRARAEVAIDSIRQTAATPFVDDTTRIATSEPSVGGS